MAQKKTSTAKTQQLTLRIDDKTRFQLDFCARVTGMSITTFVERAILEKANNTLVDTSSKRGEFAGLETMGKDWSEFWDPDEGIRQIRMLNELSKYGSYTTFEEDQLISFIRAHWHFFSENSSLTALSRDRVNSLWPHIHETLEFWIETRESNPKGAENVIRRTLEESGLKAAANIDDEIPF